MERKTWLYGCRSGIQKGVRRGDASVVKTCFDALWGDQEHRKWLLWRIPIMVGEDAWHMAGELYNTQQEVKAAGGVAAEKDLWLRFMMRLAIAVKNKDWEVMSPELFMESHHPEAVVSQALWEKISAACGKDKPQLFSRDGILEVIDDTVTWHRPPLNGYEKGAIKAMDSRKYQGGMLGDRWGCIAVMMLVWMRGLNEDEIQQMLEEQKRKFAGTVVKTLETLPWYSFDMHTRPGQMAMRVWIKRYNPYGLTFEQLDGLWFCIESAKVGREVMPKRRGDPDLVPEPTWRDEIWWSMGRKLAIEKAVDGKYTAEVMIDRWQREHAQEMEKLVAWAIKKTDEKK